MKNNTVKTVTPKRANQQRNETANTARPKKLCCECKHCHANRWKLPSKVAILGISSPKHKTNILDALVMSLMIWRGWRQVGPLGYLLAFFSLYNSLHHLQYYQRHEYQRPEIHLRRRQVHEWQRLEKHRRRPLRHIRVKNRRNSFLFTPVIYR